MKNLSKPIAVSALFLIWLVAGGVIAGETGGAPKAPPMEVPPTSLWVLGFILGYFLTYSIRHGSKTQDVFKGFLGLSGAIGGAAGLNFVLTESTKAAGLVAYALGTLYGFLVYLLIALALAVIYSKYFAYEKEKPTTGWALFAEILGKVLLGEDLRPPPSK